jgi:amino acid permease
MRILATSGLGSRQLTRIQIYGWLEVATGSVKIIFLVIIIVTLIAINLGG